MNISLSGKVALITGGSRGIGAAAVRMFVQSGARVVFNYQKAKGPAEQLVKELGEDQCAAVACDLSGTQTAQELIRCRDPAFWAARYPRRQPRSLASGRCAC